MKIIIDKNAILLNSYYVSTLHAPLVTAIIIIIFSY